jgi:hypothetical protein
MFSHFEVPYNTGPGGEERWDRIAAVKSEAGTNELRAANKDRQQHLLCPVARAFTPMTSSMSSGEDIGCLLTWFAPDLFRSSGTLSMYIRLTKTGWSGDARSTAQPRTSGPNKKMWVLVGRSGGRLSNPHMAPVALRCVTYFPPKKRRCRTTHGRARQVVGAKLSAVSSPTNSRSNSRSNLPCRLLCLVDFSLVYRSRGPWVPRDRV